MPRLLGHQPLDVREYATTPRGGRVAAVGLSSRHPLHKWHDPRQELPRAGAESALDLELEREVGARVGSHEHYANGKRRLWPTHRESIYTSTRIVLCLC